MIRVETRAVRLLVLDPSPASRERLCRLFDGAAGIEVVADAGTVAKALCLMDETQPTEVLVDCDLPDPGSFAAVREIMAVHPLPIVMLTKHGEIPALEVRALEAGAVALTAWKPGTSAAEKAGQELVRLVRAMAEVKVVRRRGRGDNAGAGAAPTAGERTPPAAPTAQNRIEIIAIGASTGGPPALQKILSALPRPLPVPVLLVQHLAPGFQGSLARWLAESSGVPVVPGQHGTTVSPGVVYLAPDDRHMSMDAAGRLVLSEEPPENGSRPSVSVLFRSVAQAYGAHAIGILLTGMGRDGAKELKLMRDKGAITIAQDEETSIVHGMPGEAIKLKGARYILAPDRIASVVQHHLAGWSPTRRDQGQLPLTAAQA